MEKINHPYLTAIKRTNLSVPTRFLKDKNLLKGKILDFGCGYGFDTDELYKQGYDITGYDYYYRPDYPEGKFDTIICNYVLNVLEPYAQAEVMMNVTNLLKPDGTAYFAVRRDLKEEGFRLHAIHRQYTYQCNVKLPFKSLECNSSYELYQYNHFNKLPRMENTVCPFCRLARRVEIICETATCVAFYDGYPVSAGHALIIPKRHVASYFDLTNHEREAMNVMLQFVKQKIDERFHPDGYNIGINVNEAAGQSVFHVHIHIIPRYKGDVPNPKGGVRGVIPNKQSYKALPEKESISAAIKTQYTKSYTFEDKRKEHGNAYMPWDDEADRLLCRMYDEGKSVSLLSDIFERTKEAIRKRLKKLGKLK
ncbi:bifunctional class I SAM-dependent methyltransferase/HIT family protein [uncultured Bacteroides sp.]|uniref:bifunctional class I SAM-dependent methyltransferase/HIT family protein n=1 Tax=uncultured Bacteroides sp. TaxID=162156 RepID=UPI0026037FEF|nr:bifunctional class I SAM-dependent methyltransferase/HIT family protein [uncultured Bacteroides sp.]